MPNVWDYPEMDPNYGNALGHYQETQLPSYLQDTQQKLAKRQAGQEVLRANRQRRGKGRRGRSGGNPVEEIAQRRALAEAKHHEAIMGAFVQGKEEILYSAGAGIIPMKNFPQIKAPPNVIGVDISKLPSETLNWLLENAKANQGLTQQGDPNDL